MTSPSPKPNRFFQAALTDPTTIMTLPQHRSGTIKITVGPDPITSRIWHLPRALLTRHSTYLAKYATNPYTHSILLRSIEPRDFANFVDYMRSSIYSLNEHVPGYRAIRQNTEAAVLGMKMGSTGYTQAAIRQLHMIFLPLARLKTSNARKSSIRASDVQYVCQAGLGGGLRQLLFDAVASHWTQAEVLNIRSAMDMPGDTTSWADVYNSYPEFRRSIAESLGVGDAGRVTLLKSVEEYISPITTSVSAAQPGDEGIVEGGERVQVVGERGRPILRPRRRIPSFRRRGASEQRRVECAQSEPMDVQSWREEVSASAGRDGEVLAVDDEWTVVDTVEA
jgi:hypothetical protein